MREAVDCVCVGGQYEIVKVCVKLLTVCVGGQYEIVKVCVKLLTVCVWG